MVESIDTELIFSFPDLDAEAVLRVYFGGAHSPRDCIAIQGDPHEGLWLAAPGRFVLYLQPNRRYGVGIRYPFALLVSVRGRNAITGRVSRTLARDPQNYFSTPPQGGIDGYFLDGRVYPFRAASEAHRNPTRLEIRVFPMKAEALAHYKDQLNLVPGPGPMIHGLTLQHGGERQCEPIYEDLCCLGDWDQTQEEHAAVWVSGESQ